MFLFLFYEENKNKTKQNVALYSTDLSSIVIIARVFFTCQYKKKWAPLWFIGHFLHVRFHIYLSCHSLCPLQTGYVISLKILGVLRTTWASIGFHITHFSLLITQYSFSFSFSYLIFYSLFFSSLPLQRCLALVFS